MLVGIIWNLWMCFQFENANGQRIFEFLTPYDSFAHQIFSFQKCIMQWMSIKLTKDESNERKWTKCMASMSDSFCISLQSVFAAHWTHISLSFIYVYCISIWYIQLIEIVWNTNMKIDCQLVFVSLFKRHR